MSVLESPCSKTCARKAQKKVRARSLALEIPCSNVRAQKSVLERKQCSCSKSRAGNSMFEISCSKTRARNTKKARNLGLERTKKARMCLGPPLACCRRIGWESWPLPLESIRVKGNYFEAGRDLKVRSRNHVSKLTS